MLLDKLGSEILLFDGGFGSEIEKRGLPTNEVENLNITNPNAIQEIHLSYSKSDFITTNTFGLNRIKYHGNYPIKDIALAAINNARVTNKHIMFDIGPTGKMLKPVGDLSFDDCYLAFKEIVEITKEFVDGYILETFSDLYELKCAILAIKENSTKPIFATMTFDESGRTLTGSTPEIVTTFLENLGVNCLGVNCSLGPKDLLPIIKRILDVSHIPVMVQPNRGIPILVNGKTTYTLDVSEFYEYTKKYIELGVSVIGGCCGTNPEFIEKIAEFKGYPVQKREVPFKTIVSSQCKLTSIDTVAICGERLNPTGKKALKEALINQDWDYLIGEAVKEEEAGCDLLDLNVGVPKIDEPQTMKKAIGSIQEYSTLPLQIDSSNKEALEVGCRYYNGIPLINSVNGEEKVMDTVFPIAKKYGAVVLGLCLDEKGVPKTAEERFEIAKRIITKASEYGIPRHRIMIDTLVLTASAEQDLVKETLKALQLVQSLGVKTALGVSNVSFGLPYRQQLNKTFLAMALYAGLNMPILNPLDTEMIGIIDAYKVLLSIDKGSLDFIDKYKDVSANNSLMIAKTQEKKNTSELTLFEAVKRGLKNEIEAMVLMELKEKDPLFVVNEILIKALSEVGESYDKGTLFLPQLIQSAESAKIAFKVISDRFPKGENVKAKVVLATVKGDVHDIGKNICKVVLESYGYEVIDLGKDVPAQDIVDAYHKYNPFAIGLSALMTTTVISMEDTIKALRKNNCTSKIFVGGAVLNEEIAAQIGADYYTKDALEFVNKLDEIQ